MISDLIDTPVAFRVSTVFHKTTFLNGLGLEVEGNMRQAKQWSSSAALGTH